MALQLKFQGSEQSKSRKENSFKETWIGTEAEIDSKISTLTIGTFHSDKGFLSSWSKTQQDGKFYTLEIDYRVSFDAETAGSNTDSTVYGKKSATLNVRNIQLPLENHKNYKTCWNYFLFSKGGDTPSFWKEAKDLTGADGKNYQWGKDPVTCPQGWTIISPTKPGVEVYDLACYTVSITEKHGSASSAGNAIQKKINKIVRPSEDFSIDGGNWKLDDCSVSHNGKHWVSTMTFTRSGDESGWDEELYGGD